MTDSHKALKGEGDMSFVQKRTRRLRSFFPIHFAGPDPQLLKMILRNLDRKCFI